MVSRSAGELAELHEVEASLGADTSTTCKSTPGRSNGRRTTAALLGSLSVEFALLLERFFVKLDADGGGTITKQEAISFWSRTGSAKVSTTTLFGQMDANTVPENGTRPHVCKIPTGMNKCPL